VGDIKVMRWSVLLLSLGLFPVTLTAAPIPHNLLGYWSGIAHVVRSRPMAFRLELALLPDESFHAKALAPGGEIDVTGTYQVAGPGTIEFVPTAAQPHLDAIPNDEVDSFVVRSGNELYLSGHFGNVSFDRMPPPSPAPTQKLVPPMPSARPDRSH
jgi:hypothetical protein